VVPLDGARPASHNLCHIEVLMLAYLFVVLSVALRFVSLPVAFTSVAASLLYFGARQPRRRLWVPLVLLVAADVVLTKLVYAYPLSADHLVTWAWYAAILLLGGTLKENSGTLRVGGAALAASVSFFLLSNFAVWAVWAMYPKTLAGLAACYLAGLPFFRHSLAGDLFFTVAFFGIGALLEGARSRMAAERVSL
jgi:hypothetical protein